MVIGWQTAESISSSRIATTGFAVEASRTTVMLVPYSGVSYDSIINLEYTSGDDASHVGPCIYLNSCFCS